MAQEWDVIIIGAGPSGSSAAIYAARAKLRTLVLAQPGRVGMLNKAESVANYPGVPGPVEGVSILRTMRAQAESFGAQFICETVIAAQLTSALKVIYTNEGGAYQTRAVIVASGALERTEKVPGEEQYWGRGVSNCTTCDAPFYHGKTVIVVGSDDVAAEEALVLAQYAARILFVSPVTPPRISAELLTALQGRPQIEMRLGWQLLEIVGAEGVRGARLQSPAGEVVEDADGIFLYMGGTHPSISFLQGQLPLDATGAILTRPDRATEVPFVYAVGDVSADHVRQAVVAAAEGCIAALAAIRDLQGRERITPDYH